LRGPERLRSTSGGASMSDGLRWSTKPRSPSSVPGRSDQLPARLPRPLVADLQGDVQDPEAFEDPGHCERAHVDWPEANRPHELEHLLLGPLVIACDEPVQRGAVGPWIGHL